MALLLERHEVEGLLGMKDAIGATESAFREQGQGKTLSHAPMVLRLEGPQRSLRVVGGALLQRGLIGIRFGKARGFERGGTLAALCDSDTGELLAVMSYSFGNVRTGATIGLVTKLLARQDAQIVGLIGAGRSALSLLQGVMCVRAVTETRVYSRDPAHRTSFAAHAESTLGVSVRPCPDPTEVVRGSDILLVATDSKVPVFDPRVMEAGLHINSMGRPCELDASVYRRADLMVVGDKNQELNLDLSGGFTQPLLHLKEESGFWDRVLELGEVVCGRGGRKNRQEITVFRESQGGWGDLALAHWVFMQARQLGLGREVSF